MPIRVISAHSNGQQVSVYLGLGLLGQKNLAHHRILGGEEVKVMDFRFDAPGSNSLVLT